MHAGLAVAEALSLSHAQLQRGFVEHYVLRKNAAAGKILYQRYRRVGVSSGT